MSDKQEPTVQAAGANAAPATEGRERDASQQSADSALKAELEAAKAQAVENLDKFLRARAETENVRRRAETDVANAHKYAIERFAGELLAVRDSLELARTVDIQQENQTALAKMHEGLDLTLKLMDDAFRKFSLVAIDPKGEKFDPTRHHAISMVESSEVPPNHVLNVMQKGYLLHDRVLRPAMVIVARAPSGGAGQEPAPTPGGPSAA
ncbi:MAG: nucleotide exchange factor GrpE [Sulfurifustaceae bacterium]